MTAVIAGKARLEELIKKNIAIVELELSETFQQVNASIAKKSETVKTMNDAKKEFEIASQQVNDDLRRLHELLQVKVDRVH